MRSNDIIISYIQILSIFNDVLETLISLEFFQGWTDKRAKIRPQSLQRLQSLKQKPPQIDLFDKTINILTDRR